MSDYILSCCTPADLNCERLNQRAISFLSFRYFLGEQEFIDDMFLSEQPKTFYDKMREGLNTKTSQINSQTYYEYFENFAKDNKTLIHATLSSGLSGSYNSARNAVEEIKKNYPNAKIYLIDSLCASSGYGLFVECLADKRDDGYTAEELFNYAEQLKLNIRHEFCSSDLTYYVKGGRISKSAGFIGNILKVCPLLNMDNNGKLVVRKKAMGTKNALNELFSTMKTQALSGKDYSYRCYISHSDCEPLANALKERVEDYFQNLLFPVEIYSIGPTIGCHSGPGTVALFFIGSKRN